MLAGPLRPSFLDTYSLSASSLGCKALCMVITFFVLWSVCWRSSLVYFKNGPEYLSRGTAQVFIPSIRFLLYYFVSSRFLVLLKYSFYIFFSYFHLFDQLSVFSSICRFPFLRAFWLLLYLVVWLLPFASFLDQHGAFHPYILTVYSNSLLLLSLFCLRVFHISIS